MAEPAIHVQNLCKNFGPVVAVDRVSFDVMPGELVGFLGQNGAGKTTTIRILTTYQPASSGYASIAGHDVMYQSLDARKSLGYLQESVPLYPEMRVEEYLLYRAKLKQVDRTIRTQRIDYCLDRCRIREVRRRLLNTLSKGYRQRVGLADSLLADPPVLILDEPLTGLDPIQQEETLGAIRELGGKHTVLFSSHHLPDVEKVCDRVIIIDRGQIRLDERMSSISQRAPIMVLEVRAPHDEARSLLQSFPGIMTVRELNRHDDRTHFELIADDGKDLREMINHKLVERGWGVRRLELRREKLEDTFMRVVFQRG